MSDQLRTGQPSAATYFVSGGSASGKSEFAERLAAHLGKQVIYLATARVDGPEMAARVRKHQASRPAHWTTVEAPRGLAGALEAAQVEAPVVLLEDLASLAAACLPWVEEADGQLVSPETLEIEATAALDAEMDGLIEWCRARSKALVIVSLEVGSGLLPGSPLGRLYKDVLGHANQRLAERADHAYYVVAGFPIDLKAQRAAVLDRLGFPNSSRDP